MARNYTAASPVMLYNAANQWTIVDVADAEAYVAAGWSVAPPDDAQSAPAEFLGEIDITQVKPAKSKGKSAAKAEE